MKLKRSLQIVILVSVFTILVFGVALAGTTQTTGTVNGITYKATVKVIELGGEIWTTKAIAETVSSLPSPSVVGWMWFQSREIFGGKVVLDEKKCGAQQKTKPEKNKNGT